MCEYSLNFPPSPILSFPPNSPTSFGLVNHGSSVSAGSPPFPFCLLPYLPMEKRHCVRALLPLNKFFFVPLNLFFGRHGGACWSILLWTSTLAAIDFRAFPLLQLHLKCLLPLPAHLFSGTEVLPQLADCVSGKILPLFVSLPFAAACPPCTSGAAAFL